MLVLRLISVATIAVVLVRAAAAPDQTLDVVDLEGSDTRDRRTVGAFLNNIADFFGYDVNKRPSAALTAAPAPPPPAPAPKAPAPPPRPPPPAPRPPPPPPPPVLTESVRKTFNIAFNWGRNVQKSAAPAPAPAPRPAPAPAPAPKPAPPPAPKPPPPPPKKVALLLADYNTNVVPIENTNQYTEEYIKKILDCADKPEKIHLDLTNQSGKDLLDDEDSEAEARRPPRYDSLADYHQSKKMFKEGQDKFWGDKPAWTEDSGYKYLTPYEAESHNGQNYQRIYRHDIATYEEVNHPGNEPHHHHHNSIRSLPDQPSTAEADASTHLDLVALLESEDNTHADTLILEQLLASFKEENLPANLGNAKVLLERGKINKYLFEYFKRKFQRDYERKKHAPVPEGPHVLHIDITTRPPPPTVKPFVSTANRDLLHILESLPTPKYEGHYGKLKEEQHEKRHEEDRGKHDHYVGNLHLGLKDHDHRLCAKVQSLKADRFVADKKMDDGESAKFLPLPKDEETRGISAGLTQGNFVPTTASTYGGTSKEELKQFINDEIKNAIKILKDGDEIRNEKSAEHHAQLQDERPHHEERPSEIRQEERVKDYVRPSEDESNEGSPIEAIKQNYDQGLNQKEQHEDDEDAPAPAKAEDDKEDFGKQIHENIKLHQDKNVEYDDEEDEKEAPKSSNLKKEDDDDEEEKENIKDINDHENLEQETIEDDEEKRSEPIKHKDEEEAEEDDYYEAPWNQRFGEPSHYRNFAENVNKISKKYEDNDDYDDRRPKYKSVDYSQRGETDNEDYDESKPHKSQGYTQNEYDAEDDDDDRSQSAPERSKTYEEIRDEKLPNNYEELADKAEAKDSGDSESVKTPQKQKTEENFFPKFFDEKEQSHPEKKPLKSKHADDDRAETKEQQKPLTDDYFQNFFDDVPKKEDEAPEATDERKQKVSEEPKSDKNYNQPTDFFDEVFSEIKSDLKANAPQQITEVKPVDNEDDSDENKESEQEESRQEERDYDDEPREQNEEQKKPRPTYGPFFGQSKDKQEDKKQSQVFAHENARPFSAKTAQLEPSEVSEDYYPIAEDIDYASGFGKKIKDVPKAQGFEDDSKSEKSKQHENIKSFTTPESIDYIPLTASPKSPAQLTESATKNKASKTQENFYNPLSNLDVYYYDTPESSSQKQNYNKDDRTTIHPFLTFGTPEPIRQIPAETIKKPSPFLTFDNLENQGDFPNFATFNQEHAAVRNPSVVDPKQQILEHKPVKELSHNKLQEPVKAALKADGPVFGAGTKSEVVQPFSGGVLHLDQELYNSDKVLAVPFDYEYSGSEKKTRKSRKPRSRVEPLSEEAKYDVKDWYTDGRSNYYPDKYTTDFSYTIPDAAPVDYTKLEKNEPEPEQDDRLSDKAKITEKTYGRKKGFVSVNQGSTET